jgi:hypothetical protein
VLVETGQVQPEERDYFVHSVVPQGVRTFTRHGATWTADQRGESLTLSMAGRFVGESLDEADEILYLTVEEFAEPSS